MDDALITFVVSNLSSPSQLLNDDAKKSGCLSYLEVYYTQKIMVYVNQISVGINQNSCMLDTAVTVLMNTCNCSAVIMIKLSNQNRALRELVFSNRTTANTSQ